MNSLALLSDAIAAVTGGGVAALTAFAQYMAWGFLVLGVCWLCVQVATGNGNVGGGATNLIIVGGFYLIVIDSVQYIGSQVVTGAVDLGMAAGGGGMGADAFLRSQDSIYAIGMAHGITLREMAEAACYPVGLGGCMTVLGTWLPLQIAGWVVFLTFVVLAALVLMTFVVFKFTMLGALVLLPAAIFRVTSGFAAGVVRTAVHAAVQIFVLAMVVAIANLVFTHMEIHAGSAAEAAMPALVAAIGVICLTAVSMSIAASLTSGGMASVSGLLTAPAMGMAAARSMAGHLDAPATAGARELVKRFSAAANADKKG